MTMRPALVLLVLALVACDRDDRATSVESEPSAAPTAEPAEVHRDGARAIVASFAQSLKAELSAGLAKGGPEAIAICHERAPAIAEALARDGWTVGRTSLALRNPKNAPDAWERKVLEDLEARRAAGAAPESLEHWELVETDGRRTFRYMKAIATAPLCLSCHGAPSESIAAALDRLYPDDRARGHAPGDLRGAFTLEKQL